MPNHPGSSLLMVCTGTGSAPMRAMTERRRRRIAQKEGGELMLFFGARTPDELPYFGPLQKLPQEFIDINFAFSRVAGAPKQYVQDRIRERSADVARLVADANCHIYVCGLKDMEDGVDAGVPRRLPRARRRLGSAPSRAPRAGPLSRRDVLNDREASAPPGASRCRTRPTPSPRPRRTATTSPTCAARAGSRSTPRAV